MAEKLGIALSSGGRGCVYQAGAIPGLNDKYGLIEPDLIAGGSGGAGNGSYYAAKQFEAYPEVWLEHTVSKDFINVGRLEKQIDIHHLIYKVFKEFCPLDVEEIKSSRTNLYISTTNLITGEVRFISNGNGETVDLLDGLHASKAMPIVYCVTPMIDDQPHADTWISASLFTSIKKLKEEGATKILAIDNEGSSWWLPIAYNAWFMHQTDAFRAQHELFEDERRNSSFENDPNIYFLRPSKPLRVGLLTNNLQTLTEAYNQGYKDVFNDKGLEKFLEDCL
tara:strand:+ start:3091 stop:3930 length:840 start_codon:yes stop_codon:yes gene_type:complete